MKLRYALIWLLMAATAGAGVAWISFGEIALRRRFFGVTPISEAQRTESGFVAIVLPRITRRPQRYAMTSADLSEFLGGLKARGYVSIGMDDVEALYGQGRQLPPKALLIGFAPDDIQSLESADEVLKNLRFRGIAFIRRIANSDPGDQGRYPTPHAIDQMKRSGTWEFGWSRTQGSRTILWSESFATRFAGSEMGLNDAQDDRRELNALSIRPERSVDEDRRVVLDSWPREAPFSDAFQARGLGADWVALWGVVLRGNGRLTILSKPRQPSAGVALRGTEQWRDLVLELDIQKYRKGFWAYARYKGDGSFLRVGASEGQWRAEQKAGPHEPTRLLASAAILPADLPARLRLVVKGDSAIVHVNGRMQFGRALRLAPSVARGRVLLGVYDQSSRSALAVLSAARAEPLGDQWIAPRGGDGMGFDERNLPELREGAIHARALSPVWVKIAADGAVAVAQRQSELIRSMAGFYGCRLVPMAQWPKLDALALGSGKGIDKLAADLAGAAARLDAAGLNLRLSVGQARSPGTILLLSKLHDVFRLRRRELWVTIDGARELDPALSGVVDGVLEPSKAAPAGLETLEALRGRARPSASANE